MIPEGSPVVHPQEANNRQPATNCAGSASHLAIHSIVLLHDWYQSPSAADCSLLEKRVPCFSEHTLAVEKAKLSNPGTAMSKWALPASHPLLHGGHLFFFITMKDQSALTASGFCTSTHLPHPVLSLSLPQQPSSGPSSSANVSEAAPTIQPFSPCSAPPCSSGSTGE